MGTSIPFTKIEILRGRKAPDWELRDSSILLVCPWIVQHMLQFHLVYVY